MINTQSDMTVNNISDNKNSSSSIQSRNSSSAQTAEKRPPSYKILIVDDEKDITLAYKTVLEDSGFNVDVFNDPLEALSKIREIYSSFHLRTTPAVEVAKTTKPYDLLLLDIKMPKMNGFELYREVRKIMKNKGDNVKVCFITAYELYYEQLKEEFPKIDIPCFIKKPISGSDLLKRIKQELLLE